MTARLPVPGSDDGTWGTVLNDFLSQSHASDGTLKANTVGASQVADGALPEAKVQNLTTDLASKVASTSVGAANGVASLNAGTKVPYSQLSLHGDVYPITEYGFFTSSVNISSCTGNSSIGNFFFARIFIPAGYAINAVALVVTGAGTVGAGGNNCFCVYDDSGNFVAQTPADNTLWSSTGWRIGVFSTPIPAQSTDRFVYSSPFITGYSAGPNIAYNNVAQNELVYRGYNKPNHRRAFYNSGSSLPASFNPVTYGSESSYIPFIAIG